MVLNNDDDDDFFQFDLQRSVDEAELLPTLYTRFEKPKKPGTAPKTRFAKKAALSPITLSVKLSDDPEDSD